MISNEYWEDLHEGSEHERLQELSSDDEGDEEGYEDSEHLESANMEAIESIRERES